MTDRLKIYNGALLICKQRSLSSLSETGESRRLLDQVWNDGGVRACLEQGQWKFAMRTAQLDYDTSITPSFGYNRAFAKGTDWVNTSAVCSDEYFRAPLLSYQDEVGYILASLDTIYVRYVSDDANFGTNYAGWPASFTEFVKAHFAAKICGKLCNDEKLVERIIMPHSGVLARAKLQAKNSDAMADPTKFPARGTWVNSRTSRYGTRSDRGNPNSLIG